MNTLSRRGYLAASAAALATIHVPRVAMAQAAAALSLSAATRTLDIDGRATTVFGLAPVDRAWSSTPARGSPEWAAPQ